MGRGPNCELISRLETLLTEHGPGGESLSSITKFLIHTTQVFGDQRQSQFLHHRAQTDGEEGTHKPDLIFLHLRWPAGYTLPHR